MNIRIGIATYGEQVKMVNSLQRTALPAHVEILNMNVLFDDLVAEAKRMEKEHLVDAFVASGGNASILKRTIGTLPVVNLVPTGYDIIAVLQRACLHSHRIGCVFFENTDQDAIKALKILGDLACLALEICTYSTRSQLESIIANMHKRGIRDVIGGGLALSVASEYNIFGHYIITEMGLVSAIRSAVELVESRRNEIIQSSQLSSVLSSISEGIIAINNDDQITLCNPSAEKLLKINSSNVIGKRVDTVLANTRLNIVRKTGLKELNQIQTEDNSVVLTNRIPIVSDGITIGALATFRDIHDVEMASVQIRNLYQQGLTAKKSFSDIIGKSVQLQNAVREAKEYAASDATILILGQTGTGKEVFAQSIHNLSARRKKPFVGINCAAIPSSLLESELFGYEEGAFTGAKRGGKRGVFEMADSGTVFMDEISEIPLKTQALLLRVIEQREVMRLGSEKIRPIDIRIIAATNKNLLRMVKEKKFREDLYYRLNVLQLHIPPLVERPDDIPITFYYYVRQYCRHIGSAELTRLSQLPELSEYSWPGNVRELRNIAERFSVLSQSNDDYEAILRGSLIQGEKQTNLLIAPSIAKKSAKKSTTISDEMIREALKRHSGNRNQTAAALGISRTTLWRRLREQEMKG